MTINKGDLQVGSGTSNQFGIFPVGANGTYPQYASAQTLGIQAGSASATPLATYFSEPVTLGIARNYGLAFNTFGTTEPVIQTTMPVAGSFQNWSVYVASNASTVDVTLTLRKNASNTTMVITITALTTGIFTAAGPVAFSVGDLVSVQNTAITTGNIVVGGSTIQYG